MSDFLDRLDDLEHPYRTRSVFVDLGLAREGDRAALKRLHRAAVIRQAPPGSTLMADLPGLIQPGPVPITDRGRRMVAARSAGHRRLLDALVSDTLPLGMRPWIPAIPPPEPAQVQQGEKTSLTQRTLHVAGGLRVPDTVGAAADVSWSTLQEPGAGDILAALVLADLSAGLAEYLAGALQDNAAAVGSLAEAVGAVEDAGWPCDVIVASHTSMAAFVELHPEATRWGGIPIVYSPAAPATFAVSQAGVYAATSPTDELRLAEPSIGGFELAALARICCEIGDGAVAVVVEAA